MTDPNDRAVVELERRIGEIRDKMDAVTQEWLEATTEFVSRAYPEYAERAVTDQPDVARERGVEGLSALKADLRTLVAKAPDLVQKQLHADALWAHRAETIATSPVSRSRYSPDSGQPPDELYAAVSRLLGEVAPLLVRHGFGAKGSFGPWVQEWGRRGSSYWRLAGRYDWSPEMARTMRRYAELYEQLHSFLTELEQHERSRQQAEARNLWEQA
jgi:hypothetical protein